MCAFVNFTASVCLRTMKVCGTLQWRSNEYYSGIQNSSEGDFRFCSYFPPVRKRTAIWMTVEKKVALGFISKKWMNEDNAAE